MTITVTVTDGTRTYTIGENTVEATRQAGIATNAANAAAAAGNYFATQALGEAGTITGEFFSYNEGGLIYAERTADGSVVIGQAATSAQITAISTDLADAIKHITPQMHGAVGDGVANDTAALTAASASATVLGAKLIIPQGTYLIDDYINVRNGIDSIIGEGGVIKCTGTSGFLLQGVAAGLAANVSNLTIQGVTFDMTGGTGIAIFARSCTDCTFRANRIIGGDTAQAGILLKAFNADLEAATGNIIADNIVTGGANVLAAGIQLTSEGTYSVSENTVSGNTTSGWQYGVGIGPNCPKTNIDGHTGFGGERAVSIQTDCDDSTIAGLKAYEFTQTGVHVLGSDRVRVSNCYATSALVVTGEAAFQAMKGSENCTFENCESYLPSSSGVGIDFHFYAGASVSGTRFVNCTARGIANRSYFCVESAYKATGDAYGRSKSGVVEADAVDDTVGAGFENCTTEGTSAKPAFSFIQTTLTDLTARALTAPIFRGCRSLGDTYNFHLYLAEETASNLSAMTLTDFASPAGVSAAKFNLPRGTAHAATVGMSSEPTLNYFDRTSQATLLNSWVDFGTARTFKIREDATGRVFLNGALKSGTTTAGTIMFTLPAGLRPPTDEPVLCYSNLAVGQVFIQSNGNVEILAGVSATDCSFNVSFPTA